MAIMAAHASRVAGVTSSPFVSNKVSSRSKIRTFAASLSILSGATACHLDQRITDHFPSGVLFDFFGQFNTDTRGFEIEQTKLTQASRCGVADVFSNGMPKILRQD